MKIILLLSFLVVGCGYNNAYKDIHDLQSQNNVQQAEISALQAAVAANEAQLQADLLLLQGQINVSEANISLLQSQYVAIMIQLVNLQAAVSGLQAENRIVGMLDPCGDMAGQFDEILLVTSSGKVVAYFEQGSKRFLSVLTPNQTYVTTDMQACVFKVNSAGQLL